MPSHGRSVSLGICAIAVGAAVAAWWLPADKAGAVWGRLGYLQLWLAIAATALASSVLVVAALPEGRRRPVGLRLGAVWIGTVAAAALMEAAAWLLPVRHQMDNPWFLAAGGGLAQADELPFGRPAHLKWSGLSRGDLSLLNGDDDPYARAVTFETDRDGFRNREDISQADIVVIGDSFAEAGNVPEEESFPALVGRRLGRSVRNLGRAGYTAPTELVVLEKHGLECRPRLVIWQIAEANDLAEVVDHESWVASGKPRFFDVAEKGRPSRAQAWQQRSPSFRLFSLLRSFDVHPWPFSGVFRDGEGNEHSVRFLLSPGLVQQAAGHPGWEGLSAALGRGVEVCRSNQIRLLVVLIPDKFRVFEEFVQLSSGLRAEVALLPGLPTDTALAAALQAFCASRRVPFLDTTEGLKSKARRGDLVYLPFDTHLSPSGHRAVAELIAEKVAELDLDLERSSDR